MSLQDIWKFGPYLFHAFQQRQRIGLVEEDALAVWAKAQPAIDEIKARWPEMWDAGRAAIIAVFPQTRDMLLGQDDVLWRPTMTWIQRDLKARGLYAGDVDGRFGPQTEDAVRRFQTWAGFKGDDVDGLPGEKTIGAMLAHPNEEKNK